LLRLAVAGLRTGLAVTTGLPHAGLLTVTGRAAGRGSGLAVAGRATGRRSGLTVTRLLRRLSVATLLRLAVTALLLRLTVAALLLRLAVAALLLRLAGIAAAGRVARGIVATGGLVHGETCYAAPRSEISLL
jgi:hypothetical protein